MQKTIKDNCPYVYCPQCKQSNSWVRSPDNDICAVETQRILWRGWKCQFCGDTAIEPLFIRKEINNDN